MLYESLFSAGGTEIIMRLNKRLSELGLCSRREADRWIEAGRVTVNGREICLGQQVSETDTIELDGRPLTKKRDEPVILAYNKPRGVVCTSSDKDRARTIVEALNYPVRVFPIGRLDKESEGLILLTNRGELVNLINRPGNNHEKEYVVTVDRALTADALNKMADGVYLSELDRTTLPCEVWQDMTLPRGLRAMQFHIVLREGMNRQIRRMCSELGYTVKRLKRIRIMKLRLDGLRSGEYREVKLEELGPLVENDDRQ